MIGFLKAVPLSLCLVVLFGCSALSEKVVFKDVADSVMERTGHTIALVNDDESQREVAREIEKLLSVPVTAETASAIALLNNKKIQATYEELGIARGELLQAGLLKNPLFEVRPRFPSGGGGVNLELGINESIFGAFFIPLKTKIAESRLEGVKASVAKEIVETSADTKRAFFEFQAAKQTFESEQKLTQAAEASFTAAKSLHKSGNSTDIEFQKERLFYEETKLKKIESEADAEDKKDKLNSLMGLSSSNMSWKESEHLPEIPYEKLMGGDLEKIAIEKNLELSVARLEIESLGKEMGLSSAEIFFNGEIGVSAERDTNGSWVVGPNLLIPLPLFDQGQAVSIEQAAKFHRAQLLYQAAVIEKRNQISTLLRNMEKARSKAKLYRDVLLPLHGSIMNESQVSYNGMLIGVFDLVSSKANELRAHEEYVAALRDFWVSRAELEKVLGVLIPCIQMERH